MTFKKGESGNPGGRPKESKDIRDLARKNAPHAFKRILELIDSKNERVAFSAAKEIIERAYGRIPESDYMTVNEFTRVQNEIRLLSKDEIDKRLADIIIEGDLRAQIKKVIGDD